MIESYKTIKGESTGDYREKGSKFLAYAYHVETEEEVAQFLDILKKEHPKSRHFCYAYRLDLEGNDFRANDDGEPSGTAGKPILGQIDSKELTKTLVVVVRYFGGKKLGASGLIHAYKVSTEEALDKAEKIEIKIRSFHIITYEFKRMNDVMRCLKHPEIKILRQDYAEKNEIEFSVPLANEKEVLEPLHEIYDIEVATKEELGE